MSNPILLLFTIINVIVTALFTGVVLRQYWKRHRAYQLFWGIALLMAFMATLAYLLMVAVSPTSSAGVALFRIYYILGGALTSAWLGLGSIALVSKANVTRICLVVLCALSMLAAVFIAMAGIDMHKLAQVAGTPGAGILQPENAPWLYTIIVLNSLGVLAVGGVAIYSGWQLWRRQGSRNLLWGNVLILAGDLIVAAAGANARLAVNSIFWVVMATGWIVFFTGVLFASRSRSRANAPNESGQGTTGELMGRATSSS